ISRQSVFHVEASTIRSRPLHRVYAYRNYYNDALRSELFHVHLGDNIAKKPVGHRGTSPHPHATEACVANVDRFAPSDHCVDFSEGPVMAPKRLRSSITSARQLSKVLRTKCGLGSG